MIRRVGLNLQPLATDPLTGIGTYTLEIVKRLPAALGEEFAFVGHVFDFAGRNGAYKRIEKILADSSSPAIPIRQFRLFPLGAYIRAGAAGRIISYQKLLGSDDDITVFFNYLRPDRVKGKSIITVYDMVSERYPETMDRKNKNLLRRFLQKSCRKADCIITISEFSKNEIIDCLGIDPRKIRVARCGLDELAYYPLSGPTERKELQDRMQEKYKILPPYILYLGTLEPRKNVDVLLDAFARIHSRFPKLRLVICGGLGWQYKKTLDHLSSLSLGDSILYTGYIPESDKRMFYACAEAFVFPSLYEGFGLPVLEAMACGTPVVCSNTSSLPEVVGDAGIMCDPKSPDSFALAIEKILADKDLRTDLYKRQLRQAGTFTWTNASQVYGQAIVDVVKSQG